MEAARGEVAAVRQEVGAALAAQQQHIQEPLQVPKEIIRRVWG